MTQALQKAIADLKAANTAFAAGTLSSVDHGNARSSALCLAVVELAASQGAQLKPISTIDSRGELPIFVTNGTKYGELFATTLNTHCNPRTGVQPGAHMTADAGWCHVGHFDAERMVLPFAVQG